LVSKKTQAPKRPTRGRAPSRDALLETLEREIRQSSALGVVFSEAVASRLGINPTDLECLDLISLRGRMTAGELARATGLTTGAVTGMIDRLERAGYARRERDAEDRRRVYVEVLPAAHARANPLYSSLARSMGALLATYTDSELALLVDFFQRSHAVMASEAEKLGQSRKNPKRSSGA
jgi:DNA-binding MarR family transcriptional regulator